jgi:HEAT repeat protein
MTKNHRNIARSLRQRALAWLLPPVLILLLSAFPLSAQQPGGVKGKGAVGSQDPDFAEQWREVLRYGIDSEVLKVIKSIGDTGERSLDPELLKLFQESLNSEVRIAILELFGETGVRSAEPAALALIAQEELDDPALAVALIRYLAAIESTSAEPELARLVERGAESTSDPRVVESALRALGTVGTLSSGDLLLEKLADPRYPEALKPQIILALGQLAYAPAVDPLMEIVRSRDVERVWRMYAASALGEIGDARAIPVLEALFREQDSLLKVYAAAGLSHFGMGEVEDLLRQGLRDSNERVRAAAAAALADPAAAGSVDILIYKAKNDPSRQVRVESIRALGKIGTPAALSYLKELYGQELAAPAYREEALTALCDNDLQRSVPAIREVVEREWDSRDQKIVGSTARILSTRESRALAPLFERFLTHPDVTVRIYGLRGIGRNRLSSLRGKVEAISEQDPHPAARRAALAVLEML